jgi:membrane protein YqaA with SNARE-associated domain
MIRRLYDWTLAASASPRAVPVLGAVSFAEASVFPIPPDVLMIPMILARPRRAWAIAFVALAGSVLGALLGYWIGAALMDSVGRPVLEFYGKGDSIPAFVERYNAWGAWAVLIAGVTPFPFKVITILSGATGLSLPVFVVSAVIARAARFYLVAALLWWFGEPVRHFIERRLGLLFTAFCVMLVGSFWLVPYL